MHLEPTSKVRGSWALYGMHGRMEKCGEQGTSPINNMWCVHGHGYFKCNYGGGNALRANSVPMLSVTQQGITSHRTPTTFGII